MPFASPTPTASTAADPAPSPATAATTADPAPSSSLSAAAPVPVPVALGPALSPPDWLSLLAWQLLRKNLDRYGRGNFTPEHLERMVISMDEHLGMAIFNSLNGDYPGMSRLLGARYKKRKFVQCNLQFPAVSFTDVAKQDKLYVSCPLQRRSLTSLLSFPPRGNGWMSCSIHE